MYALETKGLSVDFNGFKALTDLDFTLEKGELRVILGPNGAGKTTFMDLVTGKTKPTKGEILFNGKKITRMSPSDISSMGIGRKFQGPNLFENLTVTENLEIAYKGSNGVFSSLLFRKKKEMKNQLEEILYQIGLYERRYDDAAVLSHGQKQWLEMGMLLAQDPELVILDEPTTGMTAEETFKTGELVQSIFKGRSVIVVEHDMAFVRQIAKKVTVLHQGQHLAEGSLAQVERNKKVQEVYLKEETHA
ncbi:urea ABC transporter ATP-binding protein UrtD [Niallia sp. JL1B1071]|uniref:urea ABC transporter ATP-binding protein UrtD n=1 Tax=Niallia tiangongensis TaxID=3237105 RepID=UPI0037DCD8C6